MKITIFGATALSSILAILLVMSQSVIGILLSESSPFSSSRSANSAVQAAGESSAALRDRETAGPRGESGKTAKVILARAPRSIVVSNRPGSTMSPGGVLFEDDSYLEVSPSRIEGNVSASAVPMLSQDVIVDEGAATYTRAVGVSRPQDEDAPTESRIEPRPDGVDANAGRLFDALVESFEFSEEELAALEFDGQRADSHPLPAMELNHNVPQPSFDEIHVKNGPPTAILTPQPLEPITPMVPMKRNHTEIQDAVADAESLAAMNLTDAQGTVAEEDDAPNASPSPPMTKASRRSEHPSPKEVKPPFVKVPSNLIDRLEFITKDPIAHAWAQSTRNNLDTLQTITEGNDPRLKDAISNIDLQIEAAERLIEDVIRNEHFEVAAQIMRSRYELTQFNHVWSGAIDRQRSATDAPSPDSAFHLASNATSLSIPVLEPTWNEYLLLEELQAAYQNRETSSSQWVNAARATLARASSPILTKNQREFLREKLDAEFLERVADGATTPVDMPELMENLADFKETKSGYSQAMVSREFQNLLWDVENQQSQDLASEIDTHFRNANFRMSISDRMLNQLLPGEQQMHEPVRENMMGADIRGESRIANRLQLRLIPDSSRIQMRLESFGLVRSHTQASRSGFKVQNLGQTRFHAFRPLAIGQNGIETGEATAHSDTENQVLDIGSDLDPIPVLGWLARRIAQRQIEAQEPTSKALVSRKLESVVTDRLESEIDQQLQAMQQYLYRNLIEPLTILELEPTPVEMRSTESRMVMRYRVAGRDQLAAYTTRPAGLDDCLMSMQIHESAINNVLNRMELNGNSFTIESLQEHLNDVLGINMQSQADVSPSSVKANLEFAPFDPIRLAFENGQIDIELNLRRLQVNRGKVWRNLTARARYTPTLDGMSLQLTQDEDGIFVTGYRLSAKDQIAVSGIFNYLFQRQYQMRLLPQTIVAKLPPTVNATQFDVVEGWIGISIDDRSSPESWTPPGESTANRSDSFHLSDSPRR